MFLNPTFLTLYAEARMAESERRAGQRALLVELRAPLRPAFFRWFLAGTWFPRHRVGALARL